VTPVTASTRKNWIVFASAFGLTLGSAGLYFLAAGLDDGTIRIVLRYSGRIAIGILLVILFVRPLAQLAPIGWITWLRRQRRYVGITFAGIMAAHLLLIVLRVQLRPDLEFGTLGLVLGATTYAVTALMFITSFDGPTRALGPKRWKHLHRLGIAWFAIFLLLPGSLEDLREPDYWIIAGPVTLALVLRLLAWTRNRSAA